MAGIFNRYRHWVIKHCGTMGELDAVIPYVCCGLLDIPNNFRTIICILYVFVNQNLFFKP